jgi:hypothetical protein
LPSHASSKIEHAAQDIAAWEAARALRDRITAVRDRLKSDQGRRCSA